jgi:23S rRNA pseudouridine1911/1915/1917 synthase
MEFRAGKLAIGKRVDVFIADKFPDYTRSALRRLFEQQKVQVNNKIVKPGQKLKTGDKLIVEAESLRVKPEPIELPVIYKDKDVIVIDKPVGILTHAKGAISDEATVASFIEPMLNDKKLSGNRAGIVHRLDRSTSGIIICARNQKALRWLQKQFSARKVTKTYIAIVEGSLKPKEAIVNAPIGRSRQKPQTFKVLPDGKPATTRYAALKTFKKDKNEFSLVQLEPVTGRTHQIRVHMAYIGHPVAGDAVYGSSGPRMMLHAKQLELTLPNGQRKSFQAKTPKEFSKFQDE